MLLGVKDWKCVITSVTSMAISFPNCVEITPEKEAYYRQIFHKLDVDKDGQIDVAELKQAYSKMGLLQLPGQAEVQTTLNLFGFLFKQSKMSS